MTLRLVGAAVALAAAGAGALLAPGRTRVEARAKPRLRNIDGLWRKPVLGRRGAMPRPGSITEFIRERGLLPTAEIDLIIATAPLALVDFQAVQAVLPVEERAPMRRWLDDFHRATDAIERNLHNA